MEDFICDSEEVPEYDPMEAYDMSVQAEPTITLDLVPADAAGTTFNLSPAMLAAGRITPPASGMSYNTAPLHLNTADYHLAHQHHMQQQQQRNDVTFHPPGHSPRGYHVPPPLTNFGSNRSAGYGQGAALLLSPHRQLPGPTVVANGEYPAGSNLYSVAGQPPPSYQDYLVQRQNQQLPTDSRLLVAGDAFSQQQEEQLHAKQLKQHQHNVKQLPGDRIMMYRPNQGGAVNQHHAHPPPPYQTTPPVARKQKQSKTPPNPPSVAQVNLDFASIPGVNLRKSNVDLAVYVASLVPFAHPQFANIDQFAERCLACIVRKIRSNLPTLYTLLRIVRQSHGDPDPGCVLVPRTKDSRITVARPVAPGSTPTGGGSGGSKKIHPHLALVQIFRHPQAQHPGQLQPSPLCNHPFIASFSGDDGGDGLMCISPLHYRLADNPNRSPGAAARRSPTKQQQRQPGNMERTQVKKKIASKVVEKEDSDSDFISDEEDESIDWEERWRTEAVQPESTQVQLIEEETLLKEITFLQLKEKNNETVKEPVKQKVLERLKILDDLRCLFKGKYDLGSIAKLNQPRGPRAKTRKYLARQQQRELGATAQPQHHEVSAQQQQRQRDGGESSSAPEPAPGEVKKELAIQDLFENIKDNFEADMDMELDSFSQDESEFVAEEFSISNSFSMTGFGADIPGLQNEKNPDKGRGSIVAGRSSDAMVGGGSIDDREEPYVEEEEVAMPNDNYDDDDDVGGLPCIVSSWSVAGGGGGGGNVVDEASFLMFDSPTMP